MGMALVIPENFQHILRVMNTNLEGKRNTMFAITAIKGVGRRFANIALKKADIDMSKRAGELTEGRLRESSQTHVNTRSPTTSSTGKRTSRTVRPPRFFLTF